MYIYIYLYTYIYIYIWGSAERHRRDCCDVAVPAITGAKLLQNGLEYATCTGRHL